MVKAEQSRHGHFVKHESKEYNQIWEFNSINNLKWKYNELIKLKSHECFLDSNVFVVNFNTCL